MALGRRAGPPALLTTTAFSADRPNCFLHVPRTGISLRGVLSRFVPEDRESRAQIPVPDVSLHQAAHDLTRACALLSSEGLEGVFQVVVDADGTLGRGSRGAFSLFRCMQYGMWCTEWIPVLPRDRDNGSSQNSTGLASTDNQLVKSGFEAETPSFRPRFER